MERTKIYNYYYGFLAILLIDDLVLSGAKSEVYTVGDADEWNTGINYLTWSQKYNFSVGDILVFKYVKGQHNAYEVTQATFQSCDASTGVLVKYESGNDEVKLTEAKKHWFICDITGHCLGGMRFGINVNETNNTTSNNGSNQETPLSSPNESSIKQLHILYLPLIFHFVVLTIWD